jgi:hypothetical protein
MTVDEIKTSFATKGRPVPGKRISITMPGSPPLLLDGVANWIGSDDGAPVDAHVTIAARDLYRLVTGQIDLPTAFMLGKFVIEGEKSAVFSMRDTLMALRD